MLTQIEAQHALDRIILRVTGGSMQNVVSLSELWLQTPPLVEKKNSQQIAPPVYKIWYLFQNSCTSFLDYICCRDM